MNKKTKIAAGIAVGTVTIGVGAYVFAPAALAAIGAGVVTHASTAATAIRTAAPAMFRVAKTAAPFIAERVVNDYVKRTPESPIARYYGMYDEYVRNPDRDPDSNPSVDPDDNK